MNDESVGRRVLLIEDDEPYRYALGRELEAAGMHVAAFENGLQALDYLDRDGDADGMITDLRLPAGTPNGLSLALMVRRRRPKLPIVLITGSEDMAVYVDGQWGVLMRKAEGADAILQSLQEQGLVEAKN